MFRYPIEVFWSDEDQGFIAIARDLPGCSAWGETENQAINELHDAADAWMKAARTTGRAIPEPSVPGLMVDPTLKITREPVTGTTTPNRGRF